MAGNRTAKNLSQVSQGDQEKQVNQVDEMESKEAPAGVPKLNPLRHLPSQAVHQHVQRKVAHLTFSKSYLISCRCTTGGGREVDTAGQGLGSNQSQPKMRSAGKRERGIYYIQLGLQNCRIVGFHHCFKSGLVV